MAATRCRRSRSRKRAATSSTLAGRARVVEDTATRAAIFRDAKHMADAAEIPFELTLERVMHTRWEHVLTPQMRPVQQKWRAPRP